MRILNFNLKRFIEGSFSSTSLPFFLSSQRVRASLSLSLSLHVNACIGMCRKLQFQPCSPLADSLTHGLIFIAGARPAGTEAGTGTGRVLDFSCGLSMALAGKGVIVDHQAFHNLTSSQLQHKGATIPGWQYYHHYFLSFFLF